MGSTKRSREDARERSAAVAAAMRALDPEDRHLLDAEYMLPGSGAEALGIDDDDYRERVLRLVGDPNATLYAKTVVERPRAELASS
jgi:hypothetical protein